jgi:dTDP-4-amino-4,6-dideoxygalactose transaminase
MDPEALEYAFEHFQKPKAVLMVHLFGTPAKIDEIAAVCSKYDVPLIEESAESLGSTYKGIQTGNFGSCGILSFNGNKIITSSGGGALLTNSLEISEKAKFLATQAREDKPYYEHCELGYNYRLNNVSAGIGRGQMLHLDEHVAIKRRIYETYKEGLKGLPLTMNPFTAYSKPNHWLSCILLDEDCSVIPEQLRLALERHNIEARRIWKPMHLQPLYKDYVYASIHEDVCKDIFERGLCLPSDIKMTAEEQMQIINVIRTTIEGDSGVSEVL